MQLRRFWDDRKDLLRAANFGFNIKWSGLLAHLNIYLVDGGTFEWRGISLSTLPNYRSHPTVECESIFFFCAPSCSLDFVRRRLSAQFVLQVRGEGAQGQMAALTIQRTDNFLHTFLQVCCITILFDAVPRNYDQLWCFVVVEAQRFPVVRN